MLMMLWEKISQSSMYRYKCWNWLGILLQMQFSNKVFNVPKITTTIFLLNCVSNWCYWHSKKILFVLIVCSYCLLNLILAITRTGSKNKTKTCYSICNMTATGKSETTSRFWKYFVTLWLADIALVSMWLAFVFVIRSEWMFQSHGRTALGFSDNQVSAVRIYIRW